jgi:hypothetical protein
MGQTPFGIVGLSHPTMLGDAIGDKGAASQESLLSSQRGPRGASIDRPAERERHTSMGSSPPPGKSLLIA